MKQILIPLSVVCFILILFISFTAFWLFDSKSPNVSVPEVDVLPKDILLNQPNFTAEQQYFMFESHKSGGFGIAGKLAKKGSIYRWELFNKINFLGFNKPFVTCSATGRNCFENQEYKDCCGYLKANQVENYARTSNETFEFAGSEIVEGYNCVKIKAKYNEKEETVYFYAAEALKNLVIKTEVIQPDRKHTFILRNITFEIPIQLFEPIENFARNISKE